MNRAPAPAKINLALVVGPKRDDGYHEVATVLQRIDLADRIDGWTAALGAQLVLVLDQFEEHFLYHEQWFDDPSDPFHRTPGVISYDNEAGKQVRQDSRVWIAGLSDEAGAGCGSRARSSSLESPTAKR